ncbi:MAG: hypothetical protein KR126chlam2_00445 [Chlamydiae bacterium]|nr:hypothetical protein [Chlamydiota bacterium]
MTSAFEQSFKNKLQTIARERNLTPAEVWQNVIQERFLVRLCHSPYCNKFILKGGALLARYVDLGRETKDLDFSVRQLQSNVNHLTKVIKHIISIDLEDGFLFKNVIVDPLEHFHMEYAGIRIRMDACLGKARLPLFIDLGFGDLVKAKEEKITLLANLKGPLFEEDVHVHCYPREFIFAEKLETVVYRGRENSRMKDYHDLYTLVHEERLLNKEETIKVVGAVFNHRRTPLILPLIFDPQALTSLQNYWRRYRQGSAILARLPSHILQVIEAVNMWLGYE